MSEAIETTDDFEQDLKSKQKRKTVMIVAAVAVLVMGATAFFIGMGDTIGADQRAAGRAFLGDCAAGRYDTAHDRLSSDIRARFPLAKFKALVAKDKRLTTYKKMGKSYQSVGGNKDYFEGKLEYAGGSVKAQIFLTKQQGKWKISGLVLGDRDLFAAP